MVPTTQDTPTSRSGENVIKSFQLDNLSVKSKSDKEYGKQVASYIDGTVQAGYSGYYWMRNNRFQINRNYANGRLNMAKFQDLLEFNGKVNYANLNWQAIHLVNRIISGLIGRWMGRNEKIDVSAIDTLSTKEKMDEYDNLDFIISNREQLEALQQESGVQLVPDHPIPADGEELNLWASQFLRIPEEILYEMGCNDVLGASGWFDTLKEKMLHDSAETGFVGTYTWMDENGNIHVEWVKPENAIYSYSEYDDFRDTTWRGRIKSWKISEIRRKYGQEFGGSLTEEDLWKIAGVAKEYKTYDNIRWLNEWNTAFMRPYDEWNVDCLEFEIKTLDGDGYTVTKTKKNNSTLIQKGKPRKKLDDNQEYVEDSTWNIYRGVYVRSTQTLLEWGLKKNMIRPQDPKECGDAEFSYSFYMYQSYDGRNLAVPEKIQEPVDQMIIARLKMQQLVAKLKPIGSAINVDAMQNLDLGLGENNKHIDQKKLYDQTGDLYYRGRDAEGNPMPVPIQELQNNGFLSQMEGLINLYNFHYGVLKDELGEDPNLIMQAVQPRVAASNVDASQRQSENATDYMYRAYVRCMEDTSRKISCLLYKSVKYGAEVYRRLLKQEDIASRIFSTRIKMLPTEVELAKLEQFLNAAIASNPELIIYLDPFQIMRIAKENVTLAEQYIRNAQKKMYLSQRQQAQENQQQTIQGQIAAAQEAEKAKQDTESLKGDLESQKAKITADAQNKSTVLTGVMAMYQKQMEGLGTIPPELMPLFRATLESVALPAVMENEQRRQEIAMQMQQAAEAQQQPEQPQMQQEQPPVEQQQQPVNV